MTMFMARCPGCSSKFKVYNWNGELPRCPRCSASIENKLDFKRPIRISQGGSPIARAVAIAQDIAEKDYGLTDMRTGVDPGENVAPKLTKEQQVMDKAWKQAGAFQAPQRFPGLAQGQGWMDAARAATAATGRAGVQTITQVMRGMKENPMHAQVIDETRRERVRKL